MAKKVTEKKEPPRVVCRLCAHAIIDTSGISRTISTGEYFMCRCAKGHDRNRWDQLSKLFINEPRICNDYKTR